MVARGFYFSASCLLLGSTAQASFQDDYPIGLDFTERQYRVERQLVPTSTASQLLNDLIYKGVPAKGEEPLSEHSVFKLGYGGDKSIPQYDVDSYTWALQSFPTEEYHTLSNPDHEKHSLIYFLEKLKGPSYERTKEVISHVVSPDILEYGGTVHLYMSAPGTAALDNHTDVTDIVVLQLDGAKEWLLCTEKEEETTTPDNNIPSAKLDGCSTYETIEMDTLDCESTTLYPGDVLYLPRRVVHSAQALSSTYSAHLTIGYKHTADDSAMCSTFFPARELCWHGGDKIPCSCDKSCDFWCDKNWGKDSCDGSCDDDCDRYQCNACLS